VCFYVPHPSLTAYNTAGMMHQNIVIIDLKFALTIIFVIHTVHVLKIDILFNKYTS